MSRKSKLLEELGTELKKVTNEVNIENVPLDFLIELKNKIAYEITDSRADIAYQPLENVVLIVFIGVLANCNEWTEIYEFGTVHEEWLSKFLNLEYGIPSISTLRIVMSLIDPEELEKICVNIIIEKINEISKILNKKNDSEKDIIAYDGKVCRGSKRNETIRGEIKPVNAMTAFNVDKDITLATKFIEEKTNEIPTGPELIKLLDLSNTISTFDALNTQKKTISAIVKKEGDYVGALKGNQHEMYSDVVEYFEDKELYKKAYEICSYTEQEKAHGSLEKRTYILTDDIKWLNVKEWKNLRTIGVCIREFGNKQKEIRYYITSLEMENIKDFCRAVRGEWGIENNLHWHLDVTFKEDANRTMNKKAQGNLNILRKLSLNILKLIQPMYKKSLKLIRFRLGQNLENEIEKILLYLNIEELKKLYSQIQ